jgi:hypothetical protein
VSRKLARAALIVPMVMLMAVLGPGPAFASPLRNATASAYGAKLTALGLQVLPETPANVRAGPQPNSGSNNLLAVPLTPVLAAGAASAKAQTTLDSVIRPELPAGYLRVTSPAGVTTVPGTFNAQGYGKVAGANLLLQDVARVGELPPVVEAIGGITSLLSADLVHAEALISCVEGVPTIVGGAQLVGANLLGSDLTGLLDGTVNQVINVTHSVLQALGGRAVVNEQIPLNGGNGLAVNALHVEIPLLGVDIILGHAEVNGPGPGQTCEPVRKFQCEDGIDNDGDGKIDFPADPGCFSRQDDDERDLARTGGWGPGLGIAVLTGGGLLLLATYRLRRKAASEI